MCGAVQERSSALATDVSLRDTFLRFARQVGAMRALRLWQGRFLSANLAMDGALVDFGSFRGVANWRKAFGLVGEIFGEEIQSMRIAFESLHYYFQKNGVRTHPLPEPRPFGDEMAREIDAAFIGTTMQGLGVDKAREPHAAVRLEELLWNYYRRQQRDNVEVDDDEDLQLPWIYDLIRPGASAATLPASDDSRETIALARYLLDANPDTRPADVNLLNAQRWFRPRHDLFYNFAVRGAKHCVDRLPADPDNAARQVSQYIDQQVSRSRRHWPRLPSHLEVCSQVTRGYSSALYCRDRESGARRVWLEGCVSAGQLCIFDVQIPLESSQTQSRVGVELPADAICAHLGGVATLDGQPIGIPPAQLHYDSDRSEP
jgi:hypothetical protein